MPWQMSPLQVQNCGEPDLQTCTDRIYLSSWWLAIDFRIRLLTAVAAQEDDGVACCVLTS
jgi:hypothetical protein